MTPYSMRVQVEHKQRELARLRGVRDWATLYKRT